MESNPEMTTSMIFDYIAILLDKQVMRDEDFKMNFTLTDTGEKMYVHVKNGAVLKYENALAQDADVSVTTEKNMLLILMNPTSEQLEAVSQIEGDISYLKLFAENLTSYVPGSLDKFNIVEP